MKVSVPELALVAGTRGMLGAGIGLLAAGKLSKEHRRTVGRALVAIGAASTIPIVIQLLRRRRTSASGAAPAQSLL